jgi:hypothetical protein
MLSQERLTHTLVNYGPIAVIPDGGERVEVVKAGQNSPDAINAKVCHQVSPKSIPLGGHRVLDVFVTDHDIWDGDMQVPGACVQYIVHLLNEAGWTEGGFMKEGEIVIGQGFKIIHENSVQI